MNILFFLLATMAPSGWCLIYSDNKIRVKRDSPSSGSETAPTSKTKPLNPLWKSTWTDKLKQDLLVNYDKFARPVQHGNKTSVVLEPVLRHLELDEKRSIMTIHCWVRMIWNDDKLKWDPSNYNGLNELHLADHEVWQPDVFPYNSATGSTIDHYGNTNLIAFGNGTVLWVPPSIFHVFCQVDFSKWPFDTQTCNLKIGSWTYNGEQVDLLNENHGKTVYEAAELIPNSEWDYIKMTIERNKVLYPCCPTPYVDLTFYVTIKRNSAAYKALIITPASALVLLTLAMFWVPPTSGDKITLGGVAVLINCLFILFFSQKVPTMARNTPYIVIFYTRCLYLISAAIIISIFVINIATNPKSSSLPWILKKNLTGWLGKCLFIKSHEQQDANKAEELIDSQPVLSEQSRHLGETSKPRQTDWIFLATAIDRICFLLYCFAFAILALVYSV